MLSHIYFILIFLQYAEAGNVIFSNPPAEVILPIGQPFDVNWDITVDSGELFLECFANNKEFSKVIGKGINGKSFTYTPTADVVPGPNYNLRIIDEKDNARFGVSDFFSLDGGVGLKTSAQVVASSSAAPSPIASAAPSKDSQPPSASITATLISPTDIAPATSSIPVTSIPPTSVIRSTSPVQATSKPSSTIGFSTSTRSFKASSLSSSSSASETTSVSAVLTNVGSGKTGRSSSLPSQPAQTTSSVPPESTISPATNPPSNTMKMGTKVGIAMGAILGVLAILIIGFYVGKKAANTGQDKSIKIPDLPCENIERRGLVRAPSMLKAELDSEAEIREMEVREREVAELETNRKERVELERAELADTGRYEKS